MKNLLRKKIGDVPVFILVIGVVALVMIAILSFSLSNANSPRDFASIALIEEANSKIDQYNFYKDAKIGLADREIMQVLDLEQRLGRVYINVSGNVGGRSVEVIFPYSPYSLG